ncbi:MAG: lysostaphin resistance A-like protein [Flavobacteriaceae bacterium]
MFLEQVRQFKNPFWMYLLGSLIVILFNVVGQIPLSVVIMQNTTAITTTTDPMELIRALNKNVQLFLLLLPFAIAFLGFWLVVIKLHDRSLTSVITARTQLDWKRIFFSFFIWGGVTVSVVLIDVAFSPQDYQWNFNPSAFFLLLTIGVLLIPIQTSLEELLFRGYLLQGFATLTKNRWMPLLLTAVLFGSLHLFNPEVAKLGYGLLVYYIGTGLFLGIITLMDDGIELALGFHAANNLIMALLVTSTWTAFQTDSLWIDVAEPKLTTEMLLTCLVLYPLFLLLLSKKYGWKNWIHNLTKSI